MVLFSMHGEKMATQSLREHICNAYTPEVQGNLDENENPVIVGTSWVINYSSKISFDSISPGKYAIQFFHDENENQKMDFSLIGIPKEKFGSSNDVKPVLGPPKFEKMLFNLTENKKVIMVPVN